MAEREWIKSQINCMVYTKFYIYSMFRVQTHNTTASKCQDSVSARSLCCWSAFNLIAALNKVRSSRPWCSHMTSVETVTLHRLKLSSDSAVWFNAQSYCASNANESGFHDTGALTPHTFIYLSSYIIVVIEIEYDEIQ